MRRSGRLLVPLLLSLSPVVAHAQGRDTAAKRAPLTLRSVLRAITDTAPASPSSGAKRGVHASLRVLDSTIVEPKSNGARDPFALPDTVPQVVRRTCGSDVVCVPGWDLRLTRVDVPAPSVPTATEVPITLELENRGRLPSLVSEVRLCLESSEPCGTPLRPVPLPPLPAGARLTLVVPYTTEPDPDRARSVFATIDPEGATGEANRANNRARSPEFTTRAPTVIVAELTTPAQIGTDGVVPITLRVRNGDPLIPAPATDLVLSGFWHGAGTWGRGDDVRVRIPALRAGAEYQAHVAVNTDNGTWCGATPRTGQGSLYAVLRPLPGQKLSGSSTKRIVAPRVTRQVAACKR